MHHKVISRRLGLVVVCALSSGFLSACGPGFKVAQNHTQHSVQVNPSDSTQVFAQTPAGSKAFLASKSQQASAILNQLMENSTQAPTAQADGQTVGATMPTSFEPNPENSTAANTTASAPICPKWGHSSAVAFAPCPHVDNQPEPRGWQWLTGTSFLPGMDWQTIGSGTAPFASAIQQHLESAISRMKELITQLESFDDSNQSQEIKNIKLCLLDHFKSILQKLEDRLALLQQVGSNSRH